jgi:hypothetical protein
MGKRNYLLQTADPKGMEWTANGKPHNAPHGLQSTASVSILHIYIPTFMRPSFSQR